MGFIPKSNRIAVFSYLFKEGVMVVKKDNMQATHAEIEGATNLEIMNLVKSLQSKGYIRVTFNWQWYYCYLTPEGIEYLRSYLALPVDVLPATHRKRETVRPEGRERESGDRPERPAFRGGGDREYRARGGGFGRGGGDA